MHTIEAFKKYSREPIAFLKTDWGDLSILNWRTSIGHNITNDLEISDPWVSPKHGEIIYDINNFKFAYVDHSSNGTYVNGHFIHNGSIQLSDGAEIIIAQDNIYKTKMIFEVDFAALIDENRNIHVIPPSKEFVIGREGLLIVPGDRKLVSRRHATIRYYYDQGHYEIEDHSVNGTYINNRLIRNQRIILRDNDKISLGGEYEYVFKFTHCVDLPINRARRRIVEPIRYEQAAWEKILGGGYAIKGTKVKWAEYNGHLAGNYSSWKIHIYCDNVQDLFSIGRVIIPLLKNYKVIMFKTLAQIEQINELQGIQRGKAFTICICTPNATNLKEVMGSARFLLEVLEGALINPKLRAKYLYSIPGDKAVPGDRSGRLFYRYDGEKTGPGPDRGYRENMGCKHNLPGNPDIF